MDVKAGPPWRPARSHPVLGRPSQAAWALAPWLLLACLGLCGCRNPAPTPAPHEPGAGETGAAALLPDRPFSPLTPQAQADIQALLARIPSAQPEQRMELATRLTRFGEAAVPQLMQALSDSDPALRITAAYVLGLLKDPRSFDALYRATFDRVEDVRFEAGTALLRGGDDRAVPLMIAGLEHPDPRVRARSLLVLKGRTGSTFDYRADASAQDRAAAVARWRAWYEQRAAGSR